EQPLEFGDRSAPVTAVAFGKSLNANGQIPLATADNMGRCAVWLWTPRTKELSNNPRMLTRLDNQKAHEKGIVAVDFLAGNDRLLTAGLDNGVTQWDLATGEPVAGMDLRHPEGVTSMSVTPDGTKAVTTCNDNVVRLWNLETSQTIREFRPMGWSETLLTNTKVKFGKKSVSKETLEQAWKIFHPKADLQQFLEQGGWDQGVAALQAQLPEQLDNLKAPPRELAEKLANIFGDVTADDLLLASTNSAAVSPDGRFVAATNRADDIVHVWRIPASSSNYNEVIEDTINDNLQVSAVTFSPVETRTELTVLGFSDARPWRLALSTDNTLNKTASIPMAAQDDVASADFSSDGKYVVTAARDKAARVWSVEDGSALAKLQVPNGHTEAVNVAIWAPDVMNGKDGTRFLLTAGDDAQAILWKLTPSESGFTPKVDLTFKKHTSAIRDAAFSPDGKWFVTVTQDGTISVWDPKATEKPLFAKKQTDPLVCVACSQDGREILTGSENSQATIWSVTGEGENLQLEPALLLAGHSAKVTDVAFSPLEDIDQDGKISQEEKEGQRAVTASSDNTVIVWDTRIPKDSDTELPEASQVLTLKRHNRPVHAVRFSPNGRYILTGSQDHRAIVWPTENWLTEKRKAYLDLKKKKNSEGVDKPALTLSTGLLTD
ncbi:MAG: hypothetical protein KDA84_27890, partial [Planctomycetaceae bacterium]|nr:hypothetical protein [Planctomycetaceae bacterium]